MSTQARVKISTWNVIVHGQSLNVQPPGAAWHSQLFNNTGIKRTVIALGGTSWQQFLPINSRLVSRVAKGGVNNILVMLGGTSDYLAGRTGAQCYADQVTIANEARSLGVNYIVGTTTQPSTIIINGNETNRLAGNSLVLDDASSIFDQTVDLANEPGLNDASDTYYYYDGLHPDIPAAAIMADMIGVAFTNITGISL